MEQQRTVTVGVVLPLDLRARAERQAAAERRSLSGLIRNLIADHVPDNEPIAISGSGGAR